MRLIFKVVAFAITLLLLSHTYIVSDNKPLGVGYSKSIAVRVLDNPLYDSPCPRKLYGDPSVVESRAAVVFRFRPLSGDVEKCKPVTVIVDRKSGEAWLHETRMP